MRLNFTLLFLSFYFTGSSQTLIRTIQGTKYGYTDSTGSWIIPASFDSAGNFTDGFADVYKNSRAGIINTKGELISEFIWTAVSFDDNEFATVAKNDSIGYFNLTDRSVIKPQYKDDDLTFSEGLMAVSDFNNKWGYIDKKGSTIIPFTYTYAYSFNNGEARVQLNGKNYLINKSGKILREVK